MSLLFPSSLFPQVYPFQSYAVSDGLVHSGVTSIYQDSDGVYWIGTTSGLSRYDGARFLNFLDEDGANGGRRLEGTGAAWLSGNGWCSVRSIEISPIAMSTLLILEASSPAVSILLQQQKFHRVSVSGRCEYGKIDS